MVRAEPTADELELVRSLPAYLQLRGNRPVYFVLDTSALLNSSLLLVGDFGGLPNVIVPNIAWVELSSRRTRKEREPVRKALLEAAEKSTATSKGCVFLCPSSSFHEAQLREATGNLNSLNDSIIRDVACLYQAHLGHIADVVLLTHDFELLFRTASGGVPVLPLGDLLLVFMDQAKQKDGTLEQFWTDIANRGGLTSMATLVIALGRYFRVSELDELLLRFPELLNDAKVIRGAMVAHSEVGNAQQAEVLWRRLQKKPMGGAVVDLQARLSSLARLGQLDEMEQTLTTIINRGCHGQDPGVVPAIEACGKAGDIPRLRRIWSAFKRTGAPYTTCILGAIVNALGRAQQLDNMWAAFKEIAVLPAKTTSSRRSSSSNTGSTHESNGQPLPAYPNATVLNSMVYALAMGGRLEQAQYVVDELMPACDVSPDQYTFSSLLHAMGGAEDSVGLYRIEQRMEQLGLRHDRVTALNLLHGYFQARDLPRLEAFLCTAAMQRAWSWTALSDSEGALSMRGSLSSTFVDPSASSSTSSNSTISSSGPLAGGAAPTSSSSHLFPQHIYSVTPPDVIGLMMKANLEFGTFHKALALLENLLARGFQARDSLWTDCFKSALRIRSKTKTNELMRLFKSSRFAQLQASLSEALAKRERLPVHPHFLFVMVEAFGMTRMLEEMWTLWRQLVAFEVTASPFHFCIMASALSKAGYADRVRQVWKDLQHLDPGLKMLDITVGTHMMRAFVNCSDPVGLDMVIETMRRVSPPSVASDMEGRLLTARMHMHIRKSDMKGAECMLQESRASSVHPRVLASMLIQILRSYLQQLCAAEANKWTAVEEGAEETEDQRTVSMLRSRIQQLLTEVCEVYTKGGYAPEYPLDFCTTIRLLPMVGMPDAALSLWKALQSTFPSDGSLPSWRPSFSLWVGVFLAHVLRHSPASHEEAAHYFAQVQRDPFYARTRPNLLTIATVISIPLHLGRPDSSLAAYRAVLQPWLRECRLDVQSIAESFSELDRVGLPDENASVLHTSQQQRQGMLHHLRARSDEVPGVQAQLQHLYTSLVELGQLEAAAEVRASMNQLQQVIAHSLTESGGRTRQRDFVRLGPRIRGRSRTNYTSDRLSKDASSRHMVRLAHISNKKAYNYQMRSNPQPYYDP